MAFLALVKTPEEIFHIRLRALATAFFVAHTKEVSVY